MNNKRTQLYIFIAQCLFTIFLMGSLTNWFRYGMSLETGFLFLIYLGVAGLLLIPTHIAGLIVCAKKKRLAPVNVINLSLTILLVMATLGIHTIVFGLPFASVQGHITKTIQKNFINHDGEKIEYWVELKNPFHETHCEFLVLAKGDEHTRIQILAKKDDKPFIYGTDSDRIELQGSNYLLHTEFEPWIDRFFIIDSQSLNVVSNWVVNSKSTKQESNQQVEPTVKTSGDPVNEQGTDTAHP